MKVDQVQSQAAQELAMGKDVEVDEVAARNGIFVSYG